MINYMKNQNDTNRTYDTEGASQPKPSSHAEETQNGRKKKKRKKKRYLLKLSVLLLAAAAVYAFLHTDLFMIKKIQVSENSHFTSQEIKNMAGLKTGVNLFEYDSSECRDRLLKNSFIKDAEIKRSLPETVTIKVTERQEAAVIKNGKNYIIIDQEGIVLQLAEKDPKVPVISGITPVKAEENEKIQVKEERIYKNSMDLLAAMKKADLYFKRIDASREIVTAYVTDRLVCTGKKENLLKGMKEGNLKAVLYDLYKRKVKKGTVNVGDDQYYSFRETKDKKKER